VRVRELGEGEQVGPGGLEHAGDLRRVLDLFDRYDLLVLGSRELGAVSTFNYSTHSLYEETMRLTDGRGVDTPRIHLRDPTLGVDRDSEIVAFDYDERDEGVKKMVQLAVEGAKRNGKYSGLCGQAPSDYPEFAEFLVKIGIESMSLNPDSVLKIIKDVAEMER